MRSRPLPWHEAVTARGRAAVTGAALAIALLPGSGRAQSADSAVSTDSAALEVHLVTIGEGRLYWEKFGHNALWFRQPSAGIDVVFNWGTFDFDEPGYLRRLLTGDTRYWVDTVPFEPFADFYRQFDRSMVVQRLNLTEAQARKALEYARWNAQPANRYYRYDYFRDNCSTRVRDVIDLAVGGELQRALRSQQTALTYRSETLRLVDDLRVTQFGIHAALGEPADERLTQWEAAFVPSRLMQSARATRVTGPAGSNVPLVAGEQQLYASRSHGERQSTPVLWPAYLAFGVMLAVQLYVVARLGEHARIFDVIYRVEAGVIALGTGLLGLFILLAWLLTQHTFWYQNENLLVLNPLGVFLALLLFISLSRARWVRPAAILAAIIALLGALALIAKGIPGLNQNNIALILLLLPPHFAIAHALRRRAAKLLPHAR